MATKRFDKIRRMLKRDRAPLLSRREMLEKSGLGFGGLTLHGLLSGQSVPANGRRPNVLLILSDDQGFGDLGINGNTILKTPNLDRLAHEGVAFRRFYVDPICAPSRASLLTGRYHQRVGVPYADGPTDVLRLREVTIAKALRREGYATALIGKWHLGRFGAYGPLAHGFDQFLGFRDGMIAFYNDGVLEYNGEPVRSNGHVTDVFTEAAIRFMEDNRSRPFFLYLAYNAPHLPMTVPIRYEEPYRKLGVSSHLAKFYGMVTHLDESIGRVLQRLEELGLNNDTIVVFLSDNGMQKSHVQFNVSAESDRLDALWIGVDRFNAGLRSQKGTVYEGGIRVPFIARWPGRFPEGKTLNTPAAHIDIMPTLLELTNAKVPDGVQIRREEPGGYSAVWRGPVFARQVVHLVRAGRAKRARRSNTRSPTTPFSPAGGSSSQALNCSTWRKIRQKGETSSINIRRSQEISAQRSRCGRKTSSLKRI